MPQEPLPLDSLERLIAHAGLEPHREAILRCVEPALLLQLGSPGPGPVGSSRLGGAPDLPPSQPWPLDSQGEPMAFLVQVNLGAAPTFASSPLPASGMLHVFLGVDEPAHDVEHRILLGPSEGLSPRSRPECPEDQEPHPYEALVPHRIEVSLSPDLPHGNTPEWKALCAVLGQELTWNLCGERCVGQLLGHSQGMGRDPREDAHVVRELGASYLHDHARRKQLDLSPARHWRNLLRLDSCREADLLIWDAGHLNFLVRQDDLLARKLDRGYASVESS